MSRTIVATSPWRIRKSSHKCMGCQASEVGQVPWRDYATVVDIGCAQGCLPVLIAQAHGHINDWQRRGIIESRWHDTTSNHPIPRTLLSNRATVHRYPSLGSPLFPTQPRQHIARGFLCPHSFGHFNFLTKRGEPIDLVDQHNVDVA